MKKKFILVSIAALIIVVSSKAQSTGTFTDSRDGKTYKTIKIGSQTWMAENLAYKTGEGCCAYGGEQNNVETYGYLYNWGAAKDAAPAGWHVATDHDWLELEFKIDGGVSTAGKLKEIGATHWKSPNATSSDENGFAALPGGSRSVDGAYSSIGIFGHWWTSTEFDTNRGKQILMFYLTETITKSSDNKNWGFSIRCVKDE